MVLDKLQSLGSEEVDQWMVRVFNLNRKLDLITEVNELP